MSKELRIGVGRAEGAGGGVLMAAPSIRSMTSIAQAYPATNPTIFVKPPGLAVGDLIVLMIASHGGYPSSLPSGFAQLDQSTNLQVYRVTTAVKVADAADVALSSFAVGNSGGWRTGGAVYAVQDAAGVAYSACSQGYITELVIGGGFTPSGTGDLLLTMVNSAASFPTSVATANNNPSWTIDAQWLDYALIDCRHASYTTGATGAVTANFLNIMPCSAAVVAIGEIAGPAGPAFAVSRDSDGILIGVRDNAAPQFGVGRDADGLTISVPR